jgi:hypothetical protein
MKKKNQGTEPRKLHLHKETLHTLLIGGGAPSVTCMTCPDQTASAGCDGSCPATA